MKRILVFYLLFILSVDVLAKDSPNFYNFDRYFSQIHQIQANFELNDVDKITAMGFSNTKTFISIDYNYILAFDLDGNKLLQFGRDKYTPLRSFCLSIAPNGDILTSDVLNGKVYLSIYDSVGVFKKRINFHPTLRDILIDNSGNIFAGGLQVHDYNRMLKEYDKNTFFPSRKNRKIWENYFQEGRAHFITKINTEYEIIDSLMFAEKEMQPKLRAALDGIFAFDFDSINNLWVYSYPDSNISILTKNGDLVRSVKLAPGDCKIPPLVETEKQWDRLEKNNSMYFDYTLNVIEPYVFFTYEVEYRDLNNSSRKMSVYTTDGEFLERFDFPYKPYKYKNALYFWVKDHNKLRLMKCTK